MTRAPITLRFHGVRGSMVVPGPGTLRYGGNTACVELRLGQRLLILDAGSGLKRLEDTLPQAGQPLQADLLLSHTHLDHICGLPFFGPLFRPESRLRIWAGHLAPPLSLAATLRGILTPPLMPDMLGMVRAHIDYRDFQAGETLDLGDGISVATTRLHHPGGATAYRITWQGRAVVYATDTEHGLPGADTALQLLAAGADVLIHDAMLTDAEFPDHVGWGHSTWQQGVRLAQGSAVGQLVLFHHHPSRDDAEMDAIAAAADAARPGTLAAREGTEIVI